MASDILVVDDEEDIREIVSGILSDEGHETRTAHDADSALAAISDRVPRLVFLDIWMQGSRLDGLQLLDVFQSQHPDMPVVMISTLTERGAEVTMRAENSIELAGDDAARMQKLLDVLEDLDDVQDVFHNAELN